MPPIPDKIPDARSTPGSKSPHSNGEVISKKIVTQLPGIQTGGVQFTGRRGRPRLTEDAYSSGKRRTLGKAHIRVLQVLNLCKGPITRTEIAKRCGYSKPLMASWVVGYSDPDKREKFIKSKSGRGMGTPLLDLGYAIEEAIDVDGKVELGITITKEGRDAIKGLEDIKLPPPKGTRGGN